jgi:hypothetical protein
MDRKLVGAAVIGAAGAGAGVALGWTLRKAAGPDRWHSVTVNRPAEELDPKLPPLANVGFPVEIRIQTAPGDRGAELAVRATEADGRKTARRLRRALREAKAVAEVGEVLLPDAPPTTRPSLTAVPLASAARHGREEGRL